MLQEKDVAIKSNISYKINIEIQVGKCGLISCYLGDNMHTAIAPPLALLEWKLNSGQ